MCELPVFHLFSSTIDSLFIFSSVQTTVGDPATCSIGSLTSLQHRDKIEYYVKVAKDEGTL
jgi:hypothetical protein